MALVFLFSVVTCAIDYNRLRDATRTRHNRPHQLVTENRIVPSLHVQSYQRENSVEITGRGHPAAIFPLSSETTSLRDLLSSAFSFFTIMSLYARHEGRLRAQEFFNRSSPFSKLSRCEFSSRIFCFTKQLSSIISDNVWDIRTFSGV